MSESQPVLMEVPPPTLRERLHVACRRYLLASTEDEGKFLCVFLALSCDQVSPHRTWHFLAAQGYEISERERARLLES